MLDSIKISNFKAIQDEVDENGKLIKAKPLELRGLANVNYLVGKNGCGKSSVLEGLVFLAISSNLNGINLKNNILSKELDCWLFLQYGNNKIRDGVLEINNIDLNLPESQPKTEFIVDNIRQNLKRIDQDIIKNDESLQFCNFNLLSTQNDSDYEILPLKFAKLEYRNGDVSTEEIKVVFEKFGIDIKNIDKLHKIKGGLTFGDSAAFEFENVGVNNYHETSTGEQFLFMLIVKLLYFKKSVKFYEGIFILDEPENSLHPHYQKLIPKLFDYLTKDFNNVRFIISTHSPFIINAALKLENQKVYHIADGQCNNPEGYDKNSLNQVVSGIHGDLGMLPQDLFFSNCLIWVEGPTDAIYLDFWLQKYLSELSPKVSLKKGVDYEFCLFGGASANNFYVLPDDYEFKYDKNDKQKIFDMLKIHPRSFVVVDNDEGNLIENPLLNGISGFEDFKQEVIKSFDSVDYWYDKNPDNFTIEIYIVGVSVKALTPDGKSKKTKEIEYTGTKKNFAINHCKNSEHKKLDEVLTEAGKVMIQKIYEFIKKSNNL
jgi:predicted ATPase